MKSASSRTKKHQLEKSWLFRFFNFFLLIVGRNIQTIEKLKCCLAGEFEMTDCGPTNFFLMYQMLCLRPDLCFPVAYVGRFQQSLTENHWQTLKRIIHPFSLRPRPLQTLCRNKPAVNICEDSTVVVRDSTVAGRDSQKVCFASCARTVGRCLLQNWIMKISQCGNFGCGPCSNARSYGT